MAREMKDSGIEWIGQVPDTWKVVKAKYIFENHKEIAGKNQNKYDRLSLTLNGVLKRSRDDTKGLQSESLETYQILRKGELVFKMIDLNNVSTSRVGYSPYEGLVSPVYIIFHNPKYSRFGYYYFFSMWQREIYNHLGNDGVRSSLNASDMLSLPFLLPPLSEQQKIADFLDEKVKEIDNAIEKTKKTIELYKKYKQAIITKAVTKGLDPNAEMKESGVEWIGKIPKGWRVIKTKYLGNVRNGLTYSPSDITNSDSGTLVVRSSNIQNGQMIFKDNIYVSCNFDDDLLLKNGDIIICSRNGSKKLIGKNAIYHADGTSKKVTFGAFMMRLRSQVENKKYLYYLLNSGVFSYYLPLYFTSTINQLTANNFGNMLVPFTDNMLEQDQIVRYLDEKTDLINWAIYQSNQLINKYETYKKSLIYEYVTGKKEVK